MSQILKILFKFEDINIFVLLGVFFSRYFRLKGFFLTKRTSAANSETHFIREAIENQRGKLLKENSIFVRSWSSAKLFIMQSDSSNSIGNVPLTVENL